MIEEKKINVYEDGEIIENVSLSRNLDYWDNEYNCMCNGDFDMHRGVTRLTDGRIVIIFSFSNNNYGGIIIEDYGMVITKEQAIEYIVESGQLHILNQNRFADLKQEYKNKYRDVNKIEEFPKF